LFFEVLDPGVTGVSEPCFAFNDSEFCLKRLNPRRSPKLFRPVEVDNLGVGKAKCSSTDSLGESLPKELNVEDLPRLCKYARVGDDWPEFLEFGLNSAVAGDALDLLGKTERPEAGGVMTPLRVDGREGVGVV